MTDYQQITRQMGDKAAAALKRAEDAVAGLGHNVGEARGKLNVPHVELPEPLAKLNKTAAAKLPKASDIVLANFELAERLLAAQKEVTLKLLAATDPGGSSEGADEEAAGAATHNATRAKRAATTKKAATVTS